MAATDEKSTAPDGRGADRAPWILSLLERNAPPLDTEDVVALAFKWTSIELAVAYTPPGSRFSSDKFVGPQVCAAALVSVLAPSRVAALGIEPRSLIAAALPAGATSEEDSAPLAWSDFALFFRWWIEHRWAPAATEAGRRDSTAAVRFAVDEALASEVLSASLASTTRIEGALAAAIRRACALERGSPTARAELLRDLKSAGAMHLVVEATTRGRRGVERAPEFAKALDGRVVLNAPVAAERLLADRGRDSATSLEDRFASDSVTDDARILDVVPARVDPPDDEAEAAEVAAVLAALARRFGSAVFEAWRAHRADGVPLTEAAARCGLSREQGRGAVRRIEEAARRMLGNRARGAAGA